MKKFGFLLITIGFVGGSTVASMDKVIINWFYFGFFIVLGIVGVVMIQKASHKHKKGEGKLTNDISTISTSINNIVEKIEKFNSEKENVGVYDIHKKIDEIFLDDLNNFAEARESIIHVYDLQKYADLMSHFAAGERYLNRSWSASADGYIDEVYKYIEKSTEQFKITKDHFEQLQNSSKS